MNNYYISIDPGEMNGICTYDEKAAITSMQVVPIDKLVNFLEELQNVHLCICEEYRVYPQKAKQHVYNKLETLRAIGRAESWCQRNSIKLIMQPASVKSIGFKYLGISEPPRSDKLSHAKVAHAHFTYWAVKNGKIDPRRLSEG